GPSGTTRYVWCADRLLHVLEDGKPVRTRAFHPYKAHPLAEARGDGVAFLLEDQIGSVSEAVDAAGRLLWMSRKGVWAEPAENTPEGEDGFPGQIYDPESGLYYNHHRYYDPELGRYISPDPIGLLGGFNEYAYVPSPLEWLDPEGLALTGGPYPYDGPSDDTGRPALRQPGGRVVVNPRTGGGNTVEPPRAREDGGGEDARRRGRRRSRRAAILRQWSRQADADAASPLELGNEPARIRQLVPCRDPGADAPSQSRSRRELQAVHRSPAVS